jgi:RHS repeat-associated protein
MNALNSYQVRKDATMDYYPFGMIQPERTWESDKYRYGFNAMEKDDEVKGVGNSYNFGARIHDPRLGRFLSMDKFAGKFPFQSPYLFAGNTPIRAIDINGDSTYVIIIGASYLNMQSVGMSHDVGRGFKLSAEALALKITSHKDFDPQRDAVVIVYAPSTSKFVEAVNKEYESGKIASLTVFSHGTDEGISLGGEIGSMDQLLDYDLREINSVTINQINKHNFESTARCTLNSCNTGKGGKDSFAQTLADYLGISVNAFNGPSEFKTQNGDGVSLIFDGEMIRSKDRRSQKANYTTFKKGKEPKEP